jgi:DNA replication protein DnaC
MQSINNITILLDQLGLYGMKLGLSGLDKEDTKWYTRLIILLEQEREYRKSRSLNYRLKLAKFPQVKLLSDTKSAHLVEAINIAQVIQNHENLFFIGGSGAAKTHLAIALAYQALELGKKIKFFTLMDLSRNLLNAKNHNDEMQFMGSLVRLDTIVIDEFGYVPIDKSASILLFELFAKLYEQTSIFITTHLKFDEWNSMFGDQKSTKVIIDRLTHHCHIIETGNDSYRMQKYEVS